MKGTMSPELERILRDKNARVQLREALTNGLSGAVTVDGTTYQVTSAREMMATEQKADAPKETGNR